jgi:hypothetical protein
VHLLHAYDGKQAARAIARCILDIAVALLDVVMETEQAGLELVGYIRDEPEHWRNAGSSCAPGNPATRPN